MTDHLVGLMGPIIALLVTAVAGAIVRTFINAHRIKAIEEWRMLLETMQLPQCVASLTQRIRDEEEASKVAYLRNDRDHDEIKALIKDTKKDMIEAFTRSNGAKS